MPNTSSTLPRVVYRYDDKVSTLVHSLQADFNLVICADDQQLLDSIGQPGIEITAFIIDVSDLKQWLTSSTFEEVLSAIPGALRIALNDEWRLEGVIALVENQKVHQCITPRFDLNVLRSMIDTHALNLNTSASSNVKTPSMGHSESDQSTEYVLIVDDETAATKYLKKQLERRQDDFAVLCAANAEEALQVLAQYPDQIGVLMTDQRMPGQKGHQLIKEIRQRYPHIVRILTSAYGEVDVALGAVNEGKIFRYEKKPWQAEALLHTLDDAMAQYRLNRQASNADNESVHNKLTRIIENRKLRLKEGVENLVGQNLAAGIEAFFNALELMQEIQPQPVHIRASEETSLEQDLIDGVLDKCEKNLLHLQKPETLRILSRFRSWLENEGGEADNRHLQTDAISVLQAALTTLLATSGLRLQDMALQNADDKSRLVLSLLPDKHLQLYRHLLSPLSQISQPLIKQQSALMLLYLAVDSLSGEVKLESNAHACRLTIYLPVSE